MSLTQGEVKHNLFSLRQPIPKTLWEMSVRTWIRVMMQLAVISPLFIRLAELPVGYYSYKNKETWLHYMGDHAYISPKAEISCSQLQVGPKSFIDDYVTIFAYGNDGSVCLDKNVHIYRWTTVEVGLGGRLAIGANTYIQPGCLLNALVSNIIIGANCMIAARCAFTPYQHSLADTNRPMREQPLTSRGDIVIEDDVWLGVNVSVMDGVTIGTGAVVGAGAVVTEDIPPYAIAGGVPARVIRFREVEEK